MLFAPKRQTKQPNDQPANQPKDPTTNQQWINWGKDGTILQQRNTRSNPTNRIPIKSPHSKSISWNILDFQILQNFYLVNNLVSTGTTQTNSCRRTLRVQNSIIFKLCHVSNWNIDPTKTINQIFQCSAVVSAFLPGVSFMNPMNSRTMLRWVKFRTLISNLIFFSLLWPFFFYRKFI